MASVVATVIKSHRRNVITAAVENSIKTENFKSFLLDVNDIAELAQMVNLQREIFTLRDAL